jgi:hypothetical protein
MTDIIASLWGAIDGAQISMLLGTLNTLMSVKDIPGERYEQPMGIDPY